MDIRTLKGFRDYLPKEALIRTHIIKQIYSVLVSYNFDLIDTPILEYSEFLLRKGGHEVEKQIYRFKDNGDRDVSMRFDLTVPFARFMATNRSKIQFPFRRSQIGKVFRGENTQRGRYREFIQFDFDIVGEDTFRSDAEILSIVYCGLEEIFLNFIEGINRKFVIHFSHIGILNAYIDKLGLENKATFILRNIDKLDKMGIESVRENLLSQLSEEHVDLILEFISLEGTFWDKLKVLKSILEHNDAVKRVEDIFVHLSALGIQDAFNFNLKIVRGLDYYTGLVFEAEMMGINMGSICSGGRYDNLLSLFSNSLQKVSGVGGSFGIDRIQDIIEIEKFNYIKLFVVKASSRVLIVNIDDSLQDYYYKLADKFRRHDYSKINNIACEVYPKSKDGKNIKVQIEYALGKAIRFLIFVGQEEYRENKLKVRDLTKKEELLLSFDEAIKFIKGNDKFLCTPF
ncbi:histidine--tRNA ligase [Borrelia hermsii]|uniref:histidine--tRNA ligase n=1 Tax=Borrelia hermsii TaxID=140 RepID=UPI0005D8073F|nr:histidine--tRNA ligase [Borrelia hermsii]AJW72961.1 histidyl-tRNA synthase [Borrelia hermsii CC1]UCP01171.1 histidine--tRNA ligase [Borrelia hermsii]UEQ06797.1 histidine--tRNA ligase [Borrelia hermsii]